MRIKKFFFIPPREPIEPSSYRRFWRQAGEVSHVHSLGVPAQHHQREEAFLNIFPAFSIAVGTIFFTLEQKNGPLSCIAWFLVLRCSWWKLCISVKLDGMRGWAFSFLMATPWDVAKDPKWFFCTFCAMTEETGKAGCQIYEQSWNSYICFHLTIVK